jgi:hypothetical protein
MTPPEANAVTDDQPDCVTPQPDTLDVVRSEVQQLATRHYDSVRQRARSGH